MHTGYELLTEQPQLWADILMQVLRENGVPCISKPVYGAGLAVSAGLQERMKVYVAPGSLPQAQELLEDLLAPADEA